MTPEQIKAWAATATVLTEAGVFVGRFLHGWINQAHPSLTPEQRNDAYEAIIADDTVRAALAVQAARSDQ